MRTYPDGTVPLLCNSGASCGKWDQATEAPGTIGCPCSAARLQLRFLQVWRCARLKENDLTADVHHRSRSRQEVGFPNVMALLLVRDGIENSLGDRVVGGALQQ